MVRKRSAEKDHCGRKTMKIHYIVALSMTVGLAIGAGTIQGLSQTSGVDGSLGLRPTLSLCRWGAAHDPECDCREAAAPIQGRLQRPPLPGIAHLAGGLLVPALFLELPRH